MADDNNPVDELFNPDNLEYWKERSPDVLIEDMIGEISNDLSQIKMLTNLIQSHPKLKVIMSEKLIGDYTPDDMLRSISETHCRNIDRVMETAIAYIESRKNKS